MGWVACTRHSIPWVMTQLPPVKDDVWELYHVDEDFSQANNLAASNPAKLKELQAVFMKEAERNYVLPIDDAPYDSEYVPHSPDAVPENMRVIAFSDALNAVGPRQVVALSRGREDGIENGETFSIYHPGEEVVDHTDYPEGSMRRFFHPRDAKATLPPEFIGHVMIFRTFDRVSYGLVMDAVKPVHMGDFLHDPDSTP